MSNILFQAPSSFFDPSFWEELYKRKLHIYKLESSAQPILTFNSASNGKNSESFEFSHSSFEDVNTSYERCHFGGSLLNVNTVEEFRDCNKKDLLDKAGQDVFVSILNREAIRNPSLLFKFVLLTFADLKTYKFMYWLGVPAIVPDSPFTASSFRSLQDVSNSLSVSLYKALLKTNLSDLQSVFAFKDGALLSLMEAWPARDDPALYFVVPDASSSADSFGWTVRNFLALLSAQASETGSVNVIGLRGTVARKLFSEKDFSTTSLSMFQSMTDNELLSHDHSVCATVNIDPSSFKSVLTGRNVVKVVGWESNERGKPGPRVADLSNTLDGRYLMAQAVDLNLSLMKWRMWPELDMTRLSNTKCLLLGAGTLGCAVARSLLGWGVRDITLVDSGRVSYSNPARQCLFEYEDCVNKAYKATAAAERLAKIFPDVRARGVVLSIPMPGHPMQAYSGDGATTSNGEAVPKEDKDYYELKALIEEHEVIFALTDSREARWLPTAACAASNKILINAALGFDSYLVMRHGHGFSFDEADDQPHQRLGCYFCNDILAATNSMKDRTLDQMCTVTRPGLSFIAAALSVEMMVALLHSPQGIRHKAPSGMMNEEEEAEEETVIPHQIRGSLTGFTQILPQTPAFTSCTACSLPVAKAYREGDVQFVRAVCEDSKLLEEVSGAKQLMSDVNLDDCIESDDDF